MADIVPQSRSFNKDDCRFKRRIHIGQPPQWNVVCRRNQQFNPPRLGTQTKFNGRFYKKYTVHTLVYYELYSDILHAIAREKEIKKWKRRWKLQLIEKNNPDWKDLYFTL